MTRTSRLCLIDALSGLGHEVDSVPIEGLEGEPADDVVWQAATTENRFFITQDLDFSDIRKYGPDTHDGILVVRLRQPGRAALNNQIIDVFRNEDPSSLTGCFVVLTERKIRIRRRGLFHELASAQACPSSATPSSPGSPSGHEFVERLF